MYDILKLLHVLAAALWFGGGVALLLFSLRVEKRADPDLEIKVGGIEDTFGKTYFMPLAILTLVLGIVMVVIEDAWSFSQAWISIGFAGILISAVLGPGVLEPTGRKITAAAEAGDVAAIPALKQRLRMAQYADIAVLAVVFWAMVAKPGA